MSKWHGIIGFSTSQVETSPSVYEDKIVEKPYYGDMNRRVRRREESGYKFDNLVLNNELSIIADPFLQGNLVNIVYVVIHGNKWKVTEAEYEWPRVKLTIGELYNG